MNYQRLTRKNGRSSARFAFTLLELILSLSLIVLATALIGSLMQMYARNFSTRGEDIRRLHLATAILNMIAEDIRSVVVEQKYDPSVLEQQMGASGGAAAGAAGGAAAGGAAGASTLASGQTASTETTVTDESMDETVSTSYPPGIYGDQYSIMVDVSRLPRHDEYQVQQTSVMSGMLTDIPGDVKTVTYYVQSATSLGVADNMSSFASAAADATGFTSGLVRRALDRGVTAYAEEMGDTDSLARTGDLVAPEVISVEFTYFDGTEWLYEWDSSTQSLPWLIRITLAMQSATGSEKAKWVSGTTITNMNINDRQAYGIEVYELVVAIPGANLVAADAASADAAAGMDSMGL